MSLRIGGKNIGQEKGPDLPDSRPSPQYSPIAKGSTDDPLTRCPWCDTECFPLYDRAAGVPASSCMNVNCGEMFRVRRGVFEVNRYDQDVHGWRWKEIPHPDTEAGMRQADKIDSTHDRLRDQGVQPSATTRASATGAAGSPEPDHSSTDGREKA